MPGNVFALGYVGFTIPTITLPPAFRVRFRCASPTRPTALFDAQWRCFAKKFGGPAGNDPDFFKLTITALDAAADRSDRSISTSRLPVC
jgi:hypothetical protein